MLSRRDVPKQRGRERPAIVATILASVERFACEHLFSYAIGLAKISTIAERVERVARSTLISHLVSVFCQASIQGPRTPASQSNRELAFRQRSIIFLGSSTETLATISRQLRRARTSSFLASLALLYPPPLPPFSFTPVGRDFLDRGPIVDRRSPAGHASTTRAGYVKWKYSRLTLQHRVRTYNYTSRVRFLFQ